jgi:thiosulfate/3-mercaptopyruvate sulfurtransferase
MQGSVIDRSPAFDMDRVKILNGGTLEWTGFNELEKETTPPKAPGNVTLKDADPALFIEWAIDYDDVVSRRDPEVVLLDARPNDMYTGEVIRHSIIAGHIPEAFNIVSLDQQV